MNGLRQWSRDKFRTHRLTGGFVSGSTIEREQKGLSSFEKSSGRRAPPPVGCDRSAVLATPLPRQRSHSGLQLKLCEEMRTFSACRVPHVLVRSIRLGVVVVGECPLKLLSRAFHGRVAELFGAAKLGGVLRGGVV